MTTPISMKIIVVDDEPAVRRTIGDHLSARGHDVREAEDGATAIRLAGETAIDAIITDLRMPGLDGVEVLNQVRTVSPATDVIMITAYGDMDSAVEALRAGAFDFFGKPVRLRDLDASLQRMRKFRELRRENERLGAHVERLDAMADQRYGLDGIVGHSAAIAAVKTQIEQVSATDTTTVLITGETGTGKELVARAVHQSSARHQGPFIAVNCSAIAPNLIESELFGHEKGAFTDAHKARKGQFELASGGTLFLDEIGDMDLAMQTRLLRVLEERCVRRLGADEELPVDVRFVSATNRDLKAAVRAGDFREDLLYRLNTYTIAVPPLRRRREDVLLLAKHFLAISAVDTRRSVQGLSHTAEGLLREYAFPGNIRELRNMMERAVIVCTADLIQPQDLDFQATGDEEGEEVGASGSTGQDASEREAGNSAEGSFDLARAASLDLSGLERAAVVEALRRADGNQVQAAKLLGITRFTLRRRMAQYDLGDTDPTD
ncbi:MAG: sigma-54-dependent Fis family transcriptional regulator [Gemmatimonadetes bacterium]|nr:sigma-54-dependent Fis family transcriptional regulator [Gemmatimonadota bacterium]MBT7861911.1 sigma-54-dependent Fis family transcriptional regulator [Gemmatimonadota bacterium]